MINFFQNSQVKRSIVFLIMSMILIGSTIVFSYNIGSNNMRRILLREEAILIGSIVSIDEEVANKVVSAIVKEEKNEQLETKGLNLLKSYGYNEENIGELKAVGMNFSAMWFAIILIGVVLIIKECLNYRNFYGKVNKINNQLGRIINGEYTVRLDDIREGSFYVMSRNINRLIEILNKSIDGLEKEKIFLQDIISDISHQLKTPLSTLSIYNELLQGNLLGEKEQGEILDNSRNVLDRMEWLIINLLKLAKFEVNSVKFNRQKTSIKNVIERAIEALDGKIIENNNIINMFSDDVELNIDSNWVEEGFINLIKNSVEHSSEGGTIEIKLEDNIAFTRVIVKDFGEGIHENDINKIFKRFYKSKNSKKDSIGIGLALSKSIFEGNGANITVKSKASEGTQFIVTFMKI